MQHDYESNSAVVSSYGTPRGLDVVTTIEYVTGTNSMTFNMDSYASNSSIFNGGLPSNIGGRGYEGGIAVNYHDKWFDKSQEAQAYTYMQLLSEKAGKEVGAFITTQGIFIPSIDKSTFGTTGNIGIDRLNFVNNEPYLYYNKVSYKVIGAIHTHPNLNNGKGDQGLSDGDKYYAKGLGKPFFSMAWDGLFEGVLWRKNAKSYANMETGKTTSFDLMKGKISLIKLLQTVR